jgi:hypothetical protein
MSSGWFIDFQIQLLRLCHFALAHVNSGRSSQKRFGLAKLIGSDMFGNFARRIASIVSPMVFNWSAKFGVSKEPSGVARTR